MADNCKLSCKLCDVACTDLLPECGQWQRDSYCTRNRRFMAKHCSKTCGWCGQDPENAGRGNGLCADEDIKCEDWAKLGECNKNSEYMSTECPRSCKSCQQGAAASQPTTSQSTKPARSTPCVDRDRRCQPWAASGGCKQNPSVMMETCPQSCGACGKGRETRHAAAAAAATTNKNLNTAAAAAAAAPNRPTVSVRQKPRAEVCEDSPFARADCASMARGQPGACAIDFMRLNCRATCKHCTGGSKQRGGKDEL